MFLFGCSLLSGTNARDCRRFKSRKLPRNRIRRRRRLHRTFGPIGALLKGVSKGAARNRRCKTRAPKKLPRSTSGVGEAPTIPTVTRITRVGAWRCWRFPIFTLQAVIIWIVQALCHRHGDRGPGNRFWPEDRPYNPFLKKSGRPRRAGRGRLARSIARSARPGRCGCPWFRRSGP